MNFQAVEQAADPAYHPPGFFDVAQSLEAAWEVWSATRAGGPYVEQVARQRLSAVVTVARKSSSFYRTFERLG